MLQVPNKQKKNYKISKTLNYNNNFQYEEIVLEHSRIN